MSAGRTGFIGANRYGVPSDVIKHLSIRSLKTFRPLSEAWHRWLGVVGEDWKGENTRSAGADGGAQAVKVGRKHARGPLDAFSTQLLSRKKKGLEVRECSDKEIKRAM